MRLWQQSDDEAIITLEQWFPAREAIERSKRLRYTIKYCFFDTVIAVTGLTYDEAWQARKLHSLSGKTAWVEAE